MEQTKTKSTKEKKDKDKEKKEKKEKEKKRTSVFKRRKASDRPESSDPSDKGGTQRHGQVTTLHGADIDNNINKTNNNDANDANDANDQCAKETKKFARRPKTSQPARNRASICIMTSSASMSTINTNNMTNSALPDYDENDPDWEEMSQYYEKRAAYSCNDIEQSSTDQHPSSPGRTKPLAVLPWSPRKTPRRDDTYINVTVKQEEARELDPDACKRYRNGLLNQWRDPVAEYNHCFICCMTDRPGLVTITAMTDRIAGPHGDKPLFRQIIICTQCQFQRDFTNPLITLPRESIALFRPLYL